MIRPTNQRASVTCVVAAMMVCGVGGCFQPVGRSADISHAISANDAARGGRVAEDDGVAQARDAVARFDAGVVAVDRETVLCLGAGQLGLAPGTVIAAAKASCDCLQVAPVRYAAGADSAASGLLLTFVPQLVVSLSRAERVAYKPTHLRAVIDLKIQDGGQHQLQLDFVQTVFVPLEQEDEPEPADQREVAGPLVAGDAMPTLEDLGLAGAQSVLVREAEP